MRVRPLKRCVECGFPINNRLCHAKYHKACYRKKEAKLRREAKQKLKIIMRQGESS